MQESVSRAIVEALQLTLSTDERQQMDERPIADPQVYDIYLRARAAFNQGDPAALDRSIALLKQGIEIIGDNELLYAALGYAHYFYFRWISKLDIDHLELAEKYLQKTFEINPASSHGYVLQGLVSYSHGHIAETISSLTKAVEADPGNTEALLWLVVNQNYVGRCEESKQYAVRLISIDPLTPLNIFISGFAHIYSGDFAKSLPYLKRALAVDNSSPLLLWSAIIIEAWCGRVNEVFPLVDKLARLAPAWVYTQHALFLKHSLCGEKELALQHYSPDFDKESHYDCHFALHVAHCFALLHETEKALDFLGTAVRAGMINYPFLSRFDPLLENIRHEKRYESLMIEAKRAAEQLRGT
jgi:tetratricopeptide (TPR) repeat protein